MPYLHARIPTSVLAGTIHRIASALHELTWEVLGKNKGSTSVTIDLIPSERWFTRGRALADDDRLAFFLDMRITDGTDTGEEKAEYIRRVFGVMKEILGNLDEASYVAIQELQSDSWGFGGQTQERRRGLPPRPERQGGTVG